MAFSWAGAAAGAYEARQQQQADERAAAQHALRVQALQAQLAGQEDARLARQADRMRDAERQRLEHARIVTGLLSPGEIPSEQSAMLKGTPYGVLVEDKGTLPSRTGGIGGVAERVDPGGQPFTVFAGTPEQRQAATQRAALDQVIRDSSLPPTIGRFVRLRQAGVNIPNPESLETVAEREAEAARARDTEFADFTRRADYSDRLIRGRQRAPLVGKLVTPRDRLQARRWAQQDAIDQYEALKDDFGSAPDGVTLEQLAADLEAEYLAEIDPSYRRPTPPANTSRALTNLQQVFPGGRAVGSRQTPLVGTLVSPNTTPNAAKTITRAQLQETARRLGMSDQQAEAEARKRGLTVR